MSRRGPDKEFRLPASSRRGAASAWGCSKAPAIDPLDVYGLPSKGETRLHDLQIQEKFYTEIVDRYMKCCAASGGGDGLEKVFASLNLSDDAKTTKPTPENAPSNPTGQALSLSSTRTGSSEMAMILSAMRKLREGMMGSRRRDSFAQRAYMFIIHASLLAHHWESYRPALVYLLDEIHPVTPLTAPEVQEFAGYRILDLACRQNELADAFARRKKYAHRDRKVGAVLMALVRDDWVRYWRVKRAVDGYQRAIMDFSHPRMRMHALKCLGRAYLSADLAFVERSADAPWSELVRDGVGWQLQDKDNTVVIRKPKVK